MSRELHEFYDIEKIIWTYSVKKGKGIVYDGSTARREYSRPMSMSEVKFNIDGVDDYLEFVKLWKEAYANVSTLSRDAKRNKNRPVVLSLRKTANVLLWIRRSAIEVGNAIHQEQKIG